MKKFFINFIFIIFKIIPIINIIVLPFEIKTKQKKSQTDENEYYIFTKIEIGDPPQLLNCEINFDINDYFMTYSPVNVEPTFNASLSNSLVKPSKNKIYSSLFTGFFAYENFYFYTDLKCKKKELFESLRIIFPDEENKLAACEIGLQPRHSDVQFENFIHNLNIKGIINNYIWTLKFKNSNEGIIVIGGAPHEYDKNNYKESELTFINSFSDNNQLYWLLDFKQYPLNNNYSLIRNIKARISPKILGIVATYDYLTAIEETFFKKYFESNICEKKIVSFDKTNYFKIICFKDEFTSNDIKKFPSLSLYSIEFNYSFILHGKELFSENDEEIEFNILIEIGSSKIEWKLGRIFLSKYQIIFDDDNNLIGFYNYIEPQENNNQRNKLLIYIICGLIVIIFFFVAFILYNCLSSLKKRKKKANELDDDDFLYIEGKKNEK